MIFKSAVHKTLEAETEKCGAVASALITAMYLSLELQDGGAQGPAQVRPPPLAPLYSCNLPIFKFHKKLPPFQVSFPNWRSRLCLQ